MPPVVQLRRIRVRGVAFYGSRAAEYRDGRKERRKQIAARFGVSGRKIGVLSPLYVFVLSCRSVATFTYKTSDDGEGRKRRGEDVRWRAN